jgi:ABC-type phosphate transport system substrate-binding protein
VRPYRRGIEFWWSVALAALGVLVPAAVALYEFVLKGRKRLGYRVQMDTTATDVVPSPFAGALQQLQENGVPLRDPTLVLLRIENNGATNIDTRDYAVLDDDLVGIRVSFPGRRVAGLVVTELSADFLRSCFAEGSGLGVRDGVIELPKVPLNRSAHYKVLAALERAPGETGKPGTFADPEVVGGIKGGLGGGRIQETRSRTGMSWRSVGLVGFLVAVVLAQLTVSLWNNDSAPLDCAKGRLSVTGSTAFEPVVREAADNYAATCPGASFGFDMRGSGEGLRNATPDTVAFSDGEKPDGHPKLLPRPIAFFLFSLAINEEAGVEDLSVDQIRRIYRGEIVNWRDVGGNDLPVRLVSRNPGSGTRTTFQRRILGGAREPGSNSDDCRALDPGAPAGVVRCARDSTREVLDAVAATAGALGYSEVGAAADHDDVLLVRIGGHRATLDDADHGAYPFWETEYAYTFGEPAADSLAASFLRYLTNQVGQDVIRSYGNRPCADLDNPALCRPA